MPDFYDTNDLRRFQRRKRKQREYQAGYRDRLKDEKTPDRDDVAAACLRRMLGIWRENASYAELFRDGMVKDLTKRGFGEEQVKTVIDNMIERERRRKMRESREADE
jgi:hypothetical protein